MNKIAEFQGEIDYSKLSNRQLVNRLLLDGILYVEGPADPIGYFITRRGLHGPKNNQVKAHIATYTTRGNELGKLSSIFNLRVMNCLNDNDMLLQSLMISEHPAAITLLKRLVDKHYGGVCYILHKLSEQNPLLALKLMQNNAISKMFSRNNEEYLNKYLENTKERAKQILKETSQLL